MTTTPNSRPLAFQSPTRLSHSSISPEQKLSSTPHSVKRKTLRSNVSSLPPIPFHLKRHSKTSSTISSSIQNKVPDFNIVSSKALDPAQLRFPGSRSTTNPTSTSGKTSQQTQSQYETGTDLDNIFLIGTERNFTSLEDEDKKAIFKCFPEVKQICQYFPWLVLVCPNGLPAKPVSLIGGAPTIFVQDVKVFEECIHSAELFPGVPRAVDSLKDLNLNRYKCPPRNILLQMLGGMPFAIAIEYFYNTITFYMDPRSKSSPYQYPSTIGGIPTKYTFRKVGEFTPNSARLVEPIVSQMIKDNTNYWPNLCPGIMLTDGKLFSTSGVLIQREDDGNGQGPIKNCITVSQHSFVNGDVVFHAGRRIGTITHRYVDDIAICKLDNDVQYSNATYFKAETVKKISGWNDDFVGVWVEADGVTTGLQQFMVNGHISALNGPQNVKDYFEENVDLVELVNNVIWESHIASGNVMLEASQTAKGMCGAPMVRVDDGTCLGFFCLSDGLKHYFSSLDYFLGRGWTLDMN